MIGQAPATLENEALALALADLRILPEHDQRYMRYVWITDNDVDSLKAVSLTFNWISQAQLITRPSPTTHERIMLARGDLRRYAPESKLLKLIDTWEFFQFDSRFNLLLTRDTVKFAAGIDIAVPKHKRKATKKGEWELVDSPPWTQNGKTYTKNWIQKDVHYDVEVADLGADDVLRVIGEHIDKKVLAELIDRTYSQAPVVSHKYLIRRALASIKDKSLYATLYGGLYYDLAGVPQNSKKGSDEDNLLAQLGVGNVEQGITARKIFDELGSDQRTAVFRSEVTGSPRSIEYLKTLGARDSQGLAVFTRDLKRSSVDISQHAMMNLIKFKPDGTETIWERLNGMQGYATLDGNGKILEAVASSIACDRTVPAPYSTDLQAPIGCIVCHGPEGGWRISRNDVRKLLGKRFDILADRNFGPRVDVFERLAGLYAGDLELRLLPRARDDYAAVVLKATGPWKQSKDQTDIVKIAHAKVAKIFAQAAYEMVDARTVVEDFGLKAKDLKEAQDILKKLLPPLQIFANEPALEDIRIHAIMEGVPITPNDYFLVYAFMARRAQLSGGKK